MGKIIEFWQTEKDFKEFLNLIDESGAEIFSCRGEKYQGLGFDKIYPSDFQGSHIFIKGLDIPTENNEKYRWISTQANCIYFKIPIIDKNVVLNGGIVLENHVYDNKEYVALYKKLSAYIKKNYKLSKDKFAYAGPDFLIEWRKGNLLACNGPVREMEKYVYKAEFEMI